MTGSSLAQLIIPIAGTLSLTASLALVFHAGHRAASARHPEEDLRTALAQSADLRAIAEVRR